MAGTFTIGLTHSSAPASKRATVDYNAAVVQIEAAIAALNAIPQPSAATIRAVVRNVLQTLAPGNGDAWDAMTDAELAYSITAWDSYGLSHDAIQNAFQALGVIQ